MLSAISHKRGAPSLWPFWGYSLDLFQQIYVFLVLGTTKLDTVLQVESHHSGVNRDTHLPWPAFQVFPSCSSSFVCSSVHRFNKTGDMQPFWDRYVLPNGPFPTVQAFWLFKIFPGILQCWSTEIYITSYFLWLHLVLWVFHVQVKWFWCTHMTRDSQICHHKSLATLCCFFTWGLIFTHPVSWWDILLSSLWGYGYCLL